MITLNEALEKANKYHNHLCIIRGAELKDSWLFAMGTLDGETVYGPKPIRVMKNDGKIFEWDTIKHRQEFKEKFLRELDL